VRRTYSEYFGKLAHVRAQCAGAHPSGPAAERGRARGAVMIFVTGGVGCIGSQIPDS